MSETPLQQVMKIFKRIYTSRTAMSFEIKTGLKYEKYLHSCDLKKNCIFFLKRNWQARLRISTSCTPTKQNNFNAYSFTFETYMTNDCIGGTWPWNVIFLWSHNHAVKVYSTSRSRMFYWQHTFVELLFFP